MPNDRVIVVGCGFVGSIFTHEVLKRFFAADLAPRFRFVDDDTVDRRNCANQNFHPSDIGKPKAEVLSERAAMQNLYTEAKVERLKAENLDVLLDEAMLVVDGVDNLDTRQLLNAFGMARKVPVLHLGVSEQGTAKVEWSHPAHETFSLRPANTVGKDIKDPVSGVTPPCELARMRGVGLNVGFAGAVAAAILFGFDAESFLEGKDTYGTMTNWTAHTMGFQRIPELTGRIA